MILVKAVHATGTYTGSPSYTNDIAIIELDKHLKLNDYISPVCLPQADPIAGSHAYLSGWGKVGEGKYYIMNINLVCSCCICSNVAA